jgi:sigma-B regulation protein RsbU (phosphoserine phosphatase)
MSERVGVGGHSLTLSVYRQVDTYQATIRSSIVAISITLLVIMVLFMYIGLSMVNTIARPLRALTDYTRTLVADTIQPRAGERVRRIRQQSTDEVGELANAFETMQVRLDQYIQDLKQATEEQERLNSELRIARDIQMNMLPGADQRAAFEPEFQVAADIRPARQVGGDLYDLFPIGDHQYALVIGDVADKGIPAALFMAMSKTLVRAVSMLEYQRTGGEVQPHRILKQIAGELRRNNEMFMFVTLFLGIVDTRINSLKYTSAGHPPAMLIRQGNHPEWLSQEHGVPLGIQAAPDYTEQTISFEPGDTLILYTDGILEAENASGGFFGEERMMQAMKRARQDEMNPESIRRNLVEQVTGFAGGYEQSDDQTLLIIQRDGTEEFSSSQNDNKIHIEVGENNGEVRKVLDVLEEFSALHTLPEEAEHDLSLILEEYIANLTKYGFLREQNPWLQVSMKQQGQAIQLEIQDNGQPFDLNQSPMEELKQRSAAEHPGEHGLLIIRSLAASVDYNRKTDHNECVIRYRYQ